MDQSTSSSQHSTSWWAWALWFGVLTGLAQVALLTFVRTVTGRLIFVGAAAIWMAPLADVCVFAAISLVASFIPRTKTTTWLVLSLFVGLFLLGPALLVPRLHPIAAVFLCVGVAAQAGRLLLKWESQFDRLIRVTSLGLVAAVVAASVSLSMVRKSAEWRATATAHAEGGHPNILLIVLDTVRARNLHLYGYARATSPALDRLARDGTTFERAFSTSPWTLPSHASMFTGRFPHELTTDWLTPLDDTHPTLAETLRDNGYVTAGFVGNLKYTSTETGLARGFIQYHDYAVTAPTVLWTSWLTRTLVGPFRRWAVDSDHFMRKRASDVTDEFLSWLESRPSTPFFAFLNYFDAHAPYRPAEPYDRMFGTGIPVPPDLRSKRDWSQEDIQRAIDAYDGNIVQLDHEIGVLLANLRTQGLLENTLVIVTADHGEQFGAHGLFDHGNSLYRQVLQVPLVMSLPGKLERGRRIPNPVTLADLAVTIMEMAGIQNEKHIPGQAMIPRLEDGDPTNDESRVLAEVSRGINTEAWLPISQGTLQSVVLDGMHYIRRSDGREELYDLNSDVLESTNVVDRPETQEKLIRLRDELGKLCGQPCTFGAAAVAN